MMLKITLWGTPDDVTAAALRVQGVFRVLGESQNEPDETGVWVKRHLEISLEVKEMVSPELKTLQPGQR